MIVLTKGVMDIAYQSITLVHSIAKWTRWQHGSGQQTEDHHLGNRQRITRVRLCYMQRISRVCLGSKQKISEVWQGNKPKIGKVWQGSRQRNSGTRLCSSPRICGAWLGSRQRISGIRLVSSIWATLGMFPSGVLSLGWYYWSNIRAISWKGPIPG